MKDKIMQDRVSITRHGHVAHVEMIREDKMNALDKDMMEGLVEAAETLSQEDDVRAVVLSGRGKAFCAGLDVSNFASMMSGEKSNVETIPLTERTHGIANLFQKCSFAWHQLEVPVIAAAHNTCIGGGLQIYLGSDIRFAAPGTKFSIMEIKWGLIPDMGATPIMYHLARRDVINELTYTGRIFESEEAHQIGFVSHIAEDPFAAALKMAQTIASKNPDAIRASKKLLSRAPYLSEAEGLMMEAELQQAVIGTPNQIEAVMAEMEKRPAKFSDSKK